MQKNDLEHITRELLSVPPLIFRGVRRKLVKSSLAEFDVNITPLHFEILHLLQEEGPLHLSQIGAKLQVAKAQMTKLIDKLVALKMVERMADKTDRRTINIELTSYGKTIISDHHADLINRVGESIASLSDMELTELSESLKIIRELLLKLQ